MSDDAELLYQYATKGSQEAFRELVGRHVGWVHAVARRLVGGDTHLAEEVAQRVFTDLARKAAGVARHPSVSAWLHRSTRFAATDARRADLRRRRHAAELPLLPGLTVASPPNLSAEELAGAMDEALEELGASDREGVMLRYFENQPFAEIGRIMRLTEDAARLRVERALEKIRVRLARRGITSTQAMLGAVLVSEAGQAAPAGLAISVVNAALSGGAAGITAIFAMSITKLQIGLALLALASGISGYALQRVEDAGMRAASVRTKPLYLSPISAAPAAPPEISSGRLTVTDLLKENERSRRARLLRDLLAEADEAELRRILGELERTPASLAKWKLVSAVYERWGKIAPKNALAYVQTLSRPEREGREEDILSGWLGADAKGAWAWTVENPLQDASVPPWERVTVRLRPMALKLVESGQAQVALDLAMAMEPGSPQNSLVNRIAETQMKYDPQATIAWSVALPADSTLLRTNVTMNIGLMLAKESPAALNDYLGRLPAQEPLELVRAIFSFEKMSGSVFGGDIKAMSDLVMNLPDGPLREFGIERSIEAVAKTNQALALSLIASLRTPEARQRVIAGTVNAFTSGPAALDWVVGISDYPDRLQKLQGFAAAWGLREPAAARIYLETQSGLTDAERAVLLGLLSKPE